MTSQEQTPNPVTGQDIDALRSDIAALRGDTGWLRHGFWGNRWRIRLIALSLLFDVLLTVIVTVNAVGVNNACTQANQSRAAQRQLWNYVLKLSPATTPKQQQVDAQFRAYVEHVFAPKNCSFWAEF